jgi:hypothetical protein
MSWNAAAVIAAALLFAANPVTVTRALAWWRCRRRARRDWCETCGSWPRRIYEVGSHFDDDDALGMEAGGLGGSFMSATYCKAHAPAGARRKANPRR